MRHWNIISTWQIWSTTIHIMIMIFILHWGQFWDHRPWMMDLALDKNKNKYATIHIICEYISEYISELLGVKIFQSAIKNVDTNLFGPATTFGCSCFIKKQTRPWLADFLIWNFLLNDWTLFCLSDDIRNMLHPKIRKRSYLKN